MMSAGYLHPFTLLVYLSLGAQAIGALPWVEGPGHRLMEVRPNPAGKIGFTSEPATRTGIGFTNELRGDLYLTNAVAHNGAGLAIGDVDGDGWQDVYLCGLQNPNRLYRNLGNWRFEEIQLQEASCPDQLSTGATFADVDGDRDLDLLVNGIGVGTRLFLNNGKAEWAEVKGTGLSTNASATSMTLADIDGDGDLDLYCTHFIDYMHLADPTTRFAVARKGDRWEVTKVNGESTRLPQWRDRFEALPDGKVRELPEVHALYRNDGRGGFTAIHSEPGMYSDETGKPLAPFRDWGLAAMFRDIDGDGSPDLYVCNDNTSPDRIWINSGRGTFRALATPKLRHTSRSSMGVDFADLDRDGFDDFIVVDMLSREHRRRMTQLVRDRPNPADAERPEERPQYNRNTLYFGRADGFFVEAAFMAGVAASDWTWSPIFMDVDLDGFEDLLITNGFEFDVMDQDSSNEIKDPQRRRNPADLKRSMRLHPRSHTRNAAFQNQGDGLFKSMGQEWGFDQLAVSYGMAQGDLDNDGDLDVIVNNLNEAVTVYQNNAPAGRIAVRLRGVSGNTEGVGAKVRLQGGRLTQSQEMICGGRYLAGDQATRVFAVDPDATRPMSLEVTWRNGAKSRLENILSNRIYEIQQPAATGTDPHQPQPITQPNPLFEDVSSQLGHVHTETGFDDWSIQALLPHRLSKLGPGLAWYDLDGDGWEDLVAAAGRGGSLGAYRNLEGRSFQRWEGAPLSPGGQTAVLGMSRSPGDRSLLVTEGPQEMSPGSKSELLTLSVTQLSLSTSNSNAQSSFIDQNTPGPMAAADVDGDGDLDLFVGGRFRPGHFPEPVSSTLWLNEGGKLAISEPASVPFKHLGLVSGATFADLDGDGAMDLALATQWGPLRVFRNQQGRFTESTADWGLNDLTGWWTSVTVGDFDGDGRLDLAAGNWGRNTVYELYQPTTFRLFYGDWNGDGLVQMLEAWRSGSNWLPIHDRNWLARGYPSVAANFPTYDAYGRATVPELLGANFEKCKHLEATELRSMVFLNRGGRFTALPLPREAQMAPVFSINTGDADGDGIEDLFVSQNFFGTSTDLTRDDAGFGLWLKGDGSGSFKALDAAISGIRIFGEQRGAALVDFNHDGRVDLAVSQNNRPTMLYVNRRAKPGLHVALQGGPSNPDAIGARLRMVYANDRKGPCRLVSAGSGYRSQDAAHQVLGLQETPVAVWVQWPTGEQRTIPVPSNEPLLRIRFSHEKP
jgi:hypothetical protein